ncbi:hypothetical protein, partial [Streptomyces sp. ICN441]|uniref:hypothetical protein n=1 Tax=Streptomyces sp. ICN441 TaxID=2558286 RepID=UPI0019D17F13
MPKFISIGSIMSRLGNRLEFDRRNGLVAGKTIPFNWESGPRGSDRVGTAERQPKGERPSNGHWKWIPD